MYSPKISENNKIKTNQRKPNNFITPGHTNMFYMNNS